MGAKLTTRASEAAKFPLDRGSLNQTHFLFKIEIEYKVKNENRSDYRTRDRVSMPIYLFP